MITAFLLGSLRWFLVGACWTRAHGSGARGILDVAARAVAISVPLHLAVTLGLGALGLYRVPLEIGVLGALCVMGLWRTRPDKQHWRRLLPGLAVVSLLILLVLVLPPRIEWIAGGWDPGTYVAEGVSLAQEGGFEREHEPFLEFLDPDQRLLFTRERPDHGFVELMPVIPVNEDRIGTKPFFFPLTPAMTAAAYTAGGTMFATRVNVLLGGLALLLFAAALTRVERWLGLAGALALAIQPLLLYQGVATTHPAFFSRTAQPNRLPAIRRPSPHRPCARRRPTRSGGLGLLGRLAGVALPVHRHGPGHLVLHHLGRSGGEPAWQRRPAHHHRSLRRHS